MTQLLLCGSAVIAIAGMPIGEPAPSPAGPQGGDVRILSEAFDPAGHEGVTLDVPFGEVVVEGSGDSTIVAEVRLRCRRDIGDCQDRLEDVELVPRERRGRLVLELEGLGFWRARGTDVNVRLEVPAELALEVELGAGELEVSDMRSDVSVDVGAGEIRISLDESVVREVSADNGIGETRLYHRAGRQTSSGIMGGREVYWDAGPGAHVISASLGVGEIEVTLR